MCEGNSERTRLLEMKTDYPGTRKSRRDVNRPIHQSQVQDLKQFAEERLLSV